MAITLSGDGIARANLAADVIDSTKIEDDAVGTEHLANAINTDIAAKLPLAGGTMTGDTSFNDDVDIIMGGGNDLRIYSDGTNSRIHHETAGGNLIMQSDVQIQMQQFDNNEEIANFISDGAVELFHNGSKKIETTSTGINVTGAIAGATNLGKVLQVVGSKETDYTQITSTSYTSTDQELSITPTLSTSKILVLYNGHYSCNSTSGSENQQTIVTVYRGVTDLGAADGSGFHYNYVQSGYNSFTFSVSFLDSPNTTSATTYGIYAKMLYTTNAMRVNRGGNATFTLLEIGA